jgi:hypothetical protein
MINLQSVHSFIHQDFEMAYREKPQEERIQNAIQSILNAGKYYLSAIPKISIYTHPDCCSPHKEDTWDWKEENEGLFVVIEGLKGDPAISSLVYKEKIEKAHPGKYEVKVPYIVKQGDCSLKQAAEPILKMVKDYIQKNPGKPVNLIGTSNGGRIIGYVESHLRDEDVHIRITGIAGVFFGSRRIDALSKLGLASLVFDEQLIKELQVGSKTAKELILAMQEKVNLGSRSFKFYATNGDLQIPNFSSCFPKIEKAEYELVLGQDHISLNTAICPQVLEEHYRWMDSLK